MEYMGSKQRIAKDILKAVFAAGLSGFGSEAR